MIPLAVQVVRAAWRERVLWIGPLYVALTLILAPLAASLSLGSPARGLRDAFLTLLWLSTVGASVVVGARALGTELRDGSAALLASRPVSRARWAAGRALGVVLSVASVVLVGTAGFAAVVAGWGLSVDADLAWHAALLLAEGALVGTLALCLSVALRPSWAGACATALWIVGQLAGPYADMAARQGGVVAAVDTVVYAVVPDLSVFGVRDRVLAPEAVDPLAALGALAYGGAWTAGLVFLTAFLLARRDVA